MSYAKFASMVVVSTFVMFGLMYLNTYGIDHLWFSQMRAWMALLMGAAMTAIMMSFMWSMYKSAGINQSILAASAVVFILALWFARSQQTVDDISYMKAMIPHHSIAILTSERAHISDPRVRKLADGIIQAQVREIREMKLLIADLEKHPIPADAQNLPPIK